MGEMRDLETISMALTAAETGHLVFGTLHSSSAPSTITRLVDAFPPEQQEMARGMIAGSIQLVLSQQLLKRKGGGRVGCFEVMVATSFGTIREENPQSTIMQTGAQYGMFFGKVLRTISKTGFGWITSEKKPFHNTVMYGFPAQCERLEGSS